MPVCAHLCHTNKYANQYQSKKSEPGKVCSCGAIEQTKVFWLLFSRKKVTSKKANHHRDKVPEETGARY
jgi:hypothetical protein